jgi:ABC-type sugar transport system substrate-binding protein
MKQKKYLSVFLVMTVFLGLLLSACTQEAAEPTEVVDAGEDLPLIGFVAKTEVDTFHRQINTGVSDICDELVAEGKIEGCISLNADSDVTKQVANAEDLISQKVDVIVMAPVDTDGSSPVVDLCKEAGIPIVMLNSFTSNPDFDSYVGPDDEKAGEILAEEIAKRIEYAGNVYQLEGVMASSAQIDRDAGITSVLEQYPDINLTYKITANWQREKAMELTEGWLIADPEIDAIIAENDDMALGAVGAVQAAERSDEIVIGGFDAIADAVQAIRDGRLDATMFQDGVAQARKAIEVAYQLAIGEEVEDVYELPFILITAENVDEYFPAE